MSDAVSLREPTNFLIISDEEQLAKLRNGEIEDPVIDCLNQALVDNGGSKLIVGGIARGMGDYIDSSKLYDVLTDARQLAEDRNIARRQTRDIESVHTDDHAVRFVRGH